MLCFANFCKIIIQTGVVGAGAMVMVVNSSDGRELNGIVIRAVALFLLFLVSCL